MKTLILTCAATLGFAGLAAAQATMPDSQQALDALRAAGYGEVRELEFDDGLWEAEVQRDDGRWGEVSVDPANGEIFDARSPRRLIDLSEVLAALESAGYREIHDVDRDGALWDADAMGPDGQPMELRISGYDGRIIDARPDHD